MTKNLASALSIARANQRKGSADVTSSEPKEPQVPGKLDEKALARAIIAKLNPEPEPEELEDDLDFMDEDLMGLDDEPELAQTVEESSPLASIMARHRFRTGGK